MRVSKPTVATGGTAVDDGHTVIAQTETVIIAARTNRDRAPSRRPKIDLALATKERRDSITDVRARST